MKKALASWSGMRKYLEQDMLAPSLQGRVQYRRATYPGTDGDGVFEIRLDGVLAKRCSLETVNSYFLENGLKKNANPYGKSEYWEEFWALSARIQVRERPAHTDAEFCEALALYRNQNIQDSLRAENPLVRMFAILDRRVGKRTLLREMDDMKRQPPWLQAFYQLRFCAEQLDAC